MENPTRYTNYRKWAVAVGTYVALLCCVPKPSKRKSPSHGCAVSEWIRQSHADHDAPNVMYSLGGEGGGVRGEQWLISRGDITGN